MPRISSHDFYRSTAQLRATADSFGSDHPEAFRIACEALHLQQRWDDRRLPPAPHRTFPDALNSLRARLAALVADRLLASAARQPETIPMIAVLSFGTEDSARDIAHAARVGAHRLGVQPAQLQLTDATSIETAEYVGTRYSFRVTAPAATPGSL